MTRRATISDLGDKTRRRGRRRDKYPKGCTYHAPSELFNYTNLDREAVSELSELESGLCGLNARQKEENNDPIVAM